MVDKAVPDVPDIVMTEAWKTEWYQELAFEVRRIHQVEVNAIGYGGPRNSLVRLCELDGVHRYPGYAAGHASLVGVTQAYVQ